MSNGVEGGGIRYAAEKIVGAKVQTHVRRRLGPAASTALASALQTGIKGGDAKEAFASELQEKVAVSGMDQIAGVMHKITVEISEMSDTAWDYVVDACVSVVRRQDGVGWAAIFEPRTKQFMFRDIDYKVLLLCVWHVLRETFGDFFPGIPSTSPASPNPPPLS